MLFDTKQEAQDFINEHDYNAIPFYNPIYDSWGIMDSDLVDLLDLDDLLEYKIIDSVQIHDPDC